tara:strand:+ start:33574 stop:34596 length:1023 start_codon:yes stop_codon:yes gene_type:complete
MKKILPIAMTKVKNRTISGYIESWNSEMPNRQVINWENKYNKVTNFFRKKILSKKDFQKFIFKKSIKHVYIEPFSYCNRKCYFCPNSDLKRLDENKYLDRNVISKILDDLASIDFSGAMSFHEYNEPLSDKVIYSILEETSKKLKNVEIKLTTNGDYLNEKVLNLLAKYKVSYIKLSLYGPKHGHFEKDEMKKTLEKISKRTKCKIDLLKIESDKTRRHLSAKLVHKDINIEVFGLDYGDTGFDRGGVVPFSSNLKRIDRVRPCFAPSTELHIDYLGNIKPCCNLTTDREHHKDYIMGNLYDGQDIFDHFLDPTFVKFRNDTLRENPTPDACKACTWPWT